VLKRLLEHIFRPRGRAWGTGTVAGAVALAALVVGANYGHLHGHTTLHSRLVVWISALVVLVAGFVATARLSAALSQSAVLRSVPAAGSAVRVVSAGVGYLILTFSLLTVLEVSIERLLVGAGLAGVVLGIAAQQSLGNVFAGLVLLVARPFVIGDHLRIRSGALGGIFDATVRDVSLTYVTLDTDDGVLKIPNSGMLAAGVTHLRSTGELEAP
jgi:small-conductance mechanosensitive channel